jgi:hypothetical protein
MKFLFQVNLLKRYFYFINIKFEKDLIKYSSDSEIIHKYSYDIEKNIKNNNLVNQTNEIVQNYNITLIDGDEFKEVEL